MHKHLNVLGVLYIFFGLLGLAVIAGYVVARLSLALLAGLSILPFSTHGFGVILVFLFGTVSVLGIIGGIGLLLEKNWAGILILTLGFVNIFNIPLGTMLGLYTIWVLTRAEHFKLW